MKQLDVLVLPSPHARLISEGYQSLLVLPNVPKELLNTPVYFVQDDWTYGILKITKADGPISLPELIQLRDKTQLMDAEIPKHWPGITKFFVCEFEIQRAFVPPKKFTTSPNDEFIRLQTPEQLQIEAARNDSYAPVYHSGEKMGPKITLAELMRHWEKPIMLKKGYITVTGGIANWGETEGDIDVLQKDLTEVQDRDHPILFRLGRALPGEIAGRIQRRFMDQYAGPFTSHVEVYDLVLVPSEQRVVHMQRIQHTVTDSNAKKQAEKSLHEDKVLPGRFVVPLKGLKGYYKFPEVASLEITQELKPDDYPLFFQKKYDGAVTEWIKDKDSLIVRTEQGIDVTSRLPKLVALARRTFPENVSLIAETELWINGVHRPREELSGYLSAKTPPDDSNIVVNFFDIVYLDDPKIKIMERNALAEPQTLAERRKKFYESFLNLAEGLENKVEELQERPTQIIVSPTPITVQPPEVNVTIPHVKKKIVTRHLDEETMTEQETTEYEGDGVTGTKED